MATAAQYQAWLNENADKAGTEDYKTVQRALGHTQKATVASSPVASRSSDYKRGRTEAGGMARGAMSVLNGPTMGFGDELLGGIGGAYDTLVKGGKFSDNYKANRDYVRGAQDVESETNPWTTGITQTALSLPAMGLLGKGATATKALLMGPPAATAKASQMVGVTRQALNAGAQGAGFGAVAGAGNSTKEDIGGVMDDAESGAYTGGILAGGAAPVLRAVGGGVGNVAARVNDSAASRYAKEKIAEAFVRDARGRDFKSGALNPMDQAAAKLNKLGDTAVLADAGGRNTRQLLDTMVTLPGATKQAAHDLLGARADGRAYRMIDDAQASMGTQGQRMVPMVQDIVDQRSMASKPLYDALRPIVFDTPSPRLQEIVANAHELGATALGKKSALGRMQPYTLNPEVPFQWKMTDLDNLKRGMDTLISRETDAATGKVSALGVDYINLNRALKNELDALTTNPATGVSLYKSARDAFAGPTRLTDAANAGRAAMSKDEAGIHQMMRGLNASELEAFRVGAFEALRSMIGEGKGGRTKVFNMKENPVMEEKLRALFRTRRDYMEFASKVAGERRLKNLESVGSGSPSIERAFAIGDLDNSALEGVGSAVAGATAGTPGGLMQMGRGLSNAWNQVKTPEAVRDKMGEILLSGRRPVGPHVNVNAPGPVPPLLNAPVSAQQNMHLIRDIADQINQRRNMTARGLGLFMGGQGPAMLQP